MVCHVHDKRLTHEERQKGTGEQRAPEFRRAAMPRCCHVVGYGTCEGYNEAPVVESSAADALCPHEYEITFSRSALGVDYGIAPGGRRNDLRAAFRLASCAGD